MAYTLKTSSLEWAISHIRRFYSSDFFPEPFEFEAITSQWPKVCDHLAAIDLETYIPKTPLQMLAPKSNGTFRVVHQLDPLDAILYTALVHSISDDIETGRVPIKEGIACSYRILTDVNGSFFSDAQDGWDLFTNRTQMLIDEYSDGFVLICDVVDFYNQIYSHRVRNAVGELSRTDSEYLGKIVEKFLQSLNTLTSRGIPVGPAASIVLAEAVMADVDRKILAYTRDYVRWVDDFRIFFKTEDTARSFLHELTAYLHDNHRLVLSGEKTRIQSVKSYIAVHDENDQLKEAKIMKAKSQALVLEQYREILLNEAGPYEMGGSFNVAKFVELLAVFQKDEKFKIASAAYLDLLSTEIDLPHPDYTLIRRILRNAKIYRIRSILPVVLKNFALLLPVIRETCLYLRKILSASIVKRNRKAFLNILEAPSTQLPFINMWVAWLFTHKSFNQEGYENVESRILSFRDKAALALRANNRTWVKTHKNGLDTLGPYEKRAVLFASQVLSRDERNVWLGIAKSRGDFLEQIIADHLLN